jgi:hypothetical protein
VPNRNKKKRQSIETKSLSIIKKTTNTKIRSFTMTESNLTHTHQTHRIFISAPMRAADRTGLYIMFLLFSLFFILASYLIYNFISFKQYSSSLKKNNKKKNNSLTSNKQSNDGSSVIPIPSNEDEHQKYENSYEELVIPLPITTSLPIKNSFPKRLVSDL